ncbi:DUF2249 domain-containing protein [Caldimonas brevitalea]|uniref:Aminotransferase n=1 Tax=Caldimonas brevitalea TaxID=413882 RepID=A0A0G3BWI5_9BURK|nr:DUF2249 domain-containing protein [Caldimonas brevitalea]AKJ30890.1 aminotransferase [Caldimonas brevitalea]
MTQALSHPTIDVRVIPPRERHPLIFGTFHSLADGAAMEIVNDHDPRPLYFQLQEMQPGRFTWDTLESGPDVWRVRITKRAAAASEGRCCGGCGGA